MAQRFPDYFYRQSAAVPCRLREGRIEVLLITTVNKGKWTIPKGIVERHLRPEESAGEEAFEEAGIKGRVLEECVGTYRYDKWGGTCEVSVFPMLVDTVMEDWPESGIRRRRWVDGKNAPAEVNKRQLAPLVEEAVSIARRLLGDTDEDA
jgi:phosphohistidine phosphatase